MTEAVRQVISFGFRTMQLNRVQATCEVEYIASARVMEKTGMTFEGILREYLFTKQHYRDLRMYAILRTEWLTAKPYASAIYPCSIEDQKSKIENGKSTFFDES